MRFGTEEKTTKGNQSSNFYGACWWEKPIWGDQPERRETKRMANKGEKKPASIGARAKGRLECEEKRLKADRKSHHARMEASGKTRALELA